MSKKIAGSVSTPGGGIPNNQQGPPAHGEVDGRDHDCLAWRVGQCDDYEHCPYCSWIEQALRAVSRYNDTT